MSAGWLTHATPAWHKCTIDNYQHCGWDAQAPDESGPSAYYTCLWSAPAASEQQIRFWLYSAYLTHLDLHDDVTKLKYFLRHWPFVRWTTHDLWIRFTKAGDAELWCFLWSVHQQAVEQRTETQVIWDAIALIMTSLWWFSSNMCTLLTVCGLSRSIDLCHAECIQIYMMKHKTVNYICIPLPITSRNWEVHLVKLLPRARQMSIYSALSIPCTLMSWRRLPCFDLILPEYPYFSTSYDLFEFALLWSPSNSIVQNRLYINSVALSGTPITLNVILCHRPLYFACINYRSPKEIDHPIYWL